MASSPFLNTQAVETWDTWFRWRERGQLRDVTIDDTWQRVAATLAADTHAQRPGYRRRLIDAMRAWHLLLDERVLAGAGTGAARWNGDDLVAALNVASFVRAPGLPHAAIDTAALEEIAALAVFALDDAARHGAPGSAPERLRIGLLGVGDALHLLGLRYDSDAARAQAAAAAAALARGCLAGAIAVARDRNDATKPDAAWLEQAERRGQPRELIAAAQRYGLRHRALTAITPQQRLACFANRVSDALDPPFDVRCVQPLCMPDSARGAARSATPARALGTSVDAQLRLRAAVQPWIDAPIVYPVVCDATPDSATQDTWQARALELGLGIPSWRLTLAECRDGALRRQTAVV